jgi:hypothetical protein
VDTRIASAAFMSEQLITPFGWKIPSLWDEIGGNYKAIDGWIRVHTNYENHRNAALKVLGAPPNRSAVGEAIAHWEAEALEEAIVAAGGCAAAMRDARSWAAHPHGRFAVLEPAIALGNHVSALVDGSLRKPPKGGAGPLAGLRVLDVTRVIAGPVATRFLAAYGAQVLRIDPPGFSEFAAVLPFLTTGKRCAPLDLRSQQGRRTFEHLVADAHVLVHGLRPGAMAGLSYGPEELMRLNPSLIIATHDAYGWTGPWAGRRGFDSLVQMSCGIAAEGARQVKMEQPFPLPAQALDYATGYLLAAAICERIAQHMRTSAIASINASLVGVANLLMRMPQSIVSGSLAPWPSDAFEELSTLWGRVRAVRCPGTISGIAPMWSIPAGPICRHSPRWAPAA